jgi:enamine deaminase RidA (YjgF/YER057c/UK114 family)
MKIEKINPKTLHEPFDNLYAQIVRYEGRYTYRISGQVAIGLERENIGKGDMKRQLEVVYDMVTKALNAVNLTWENVVHIYTFTTNMTEYMKYEKPIAKAAFGEKPPASTLVEVTKLVDPDWLVEVQVDAVGD